MVKIGDAYYNLAQMARVELHMEYETENWYLEVSLFPGIAIPLTHTEALNVRSWLSRHEWTSPVCDPNMHKATQIPE